MTVKFNFELRAWVEGIEIDADDYEEAQQKLLRMDVADLIEEGYVKKSDLFDIEGRLTVRDIRVAVYKVKYDLSDSDYIKNGIDPEDNEACIEYEESLPQNFDLAIRDVEAGNEEEEIIDELQKKTGLDVLSCSFDFYELD